jgi:lipoprotein-releasing system ATP-binding protein
MGNNQKSDHSHLITVKNLSKSFSHNGIKIEILKNINLSLDAGEKIAVTGASGIGKSTLLHILGTLDRPENGIFLFKDKNVFLFDNERLARFRNESIGFVFQFHHLLPEFSAVENAMMPVLIKGVSKKEAKEAAEAILIRVGLKDRLSYRINKLSGGEQQRVALARALVLRPVILLADEPTGNLDEKNKKQVHDLLMELNQELNMTMIVVTHSIELASYMSHIVTIVDGQLTKT